MTISNNCQIEDLWASGRELFELRDAWRGGEAIVPILGSGISIGAGIPIGGQITDYLKGVEALARSGGYEPLRARLRARGWPGRHEIHVGLWTPPASPANGAPKQAQGGASHVTSDAPPSSAGIGQKQGWIELLNRITEGEQGLVDSFFDRLVRGRSPATAHQLVAFLTRRLGTRLIFTTNFDDLIETALLDESLAPVVYEIVKDAAPDPMLVSQHLAIIKLHGGKYELLAGKERPEENPFPKYAAYVPRSSQILILGQHEEERIKRLVRALLQVNTERRVTWVYHAPSLPRGPALADLPPNIRRVPCLDAQLFLQELYQRLFWSHPAGEHPYRALFQVPETMPSGETPDDQPEPPAEDARQTSEPTRTALSFNLYELSSLPAFLSALTEELDRHVRPLPPLMLSPSVAYAGLDYPAREELQPIWVRYIAEALRRHPFDITIDLLSAFSSWHPAHRFRTTSQLGAVQEIQIQSFARFIRKLDEESLGDSRIRLLRATPDSKVTDAEAVLSEAITERPRGAVRFENAIRSKDRDGEARQWARGILKTFASDKGYQWRLRITQVACSFRRPRPLVALVRLACHDQPQGVDPRDPHAHALREIEGEVTKLVHEDHVLLDPHRTGIYSMIESRRNALFEEFQRLEPKRANRLQHEIALYYRSDLYEQSKDWAAFVEYLFHRLASTDVPASVLDAARVRRERLAWLLGAIMRERRSFVGRGRASALLDVFKHVHWRLESERREQRVEGEESAWSQASGWLRARVRQLEADVLKDTLDIERCRKLYEEALIKHDEPRAPESPSPSVADRFHVLELLLELAECGTVAADAGTAERATADDDGTAPERSNQSRKYLARAESDIIELEQRFDDTSGGPETAYLPISRTASPLARQLAELRARFTTSRMDLDHLQRHPWEDAADSHELHISSEIVEEHDRLFNLALDRLAESSDADSMEEVRCRMRCSYARTLYLAGRWRAADKELNRALAYGSKRRDPEALLSRAIYQLHRAEYAVLRARTEDEVTNVRFLLNAALSSLERAERSLQNCRRNVLWWSRHFMLKARAHTECLRISLATELLPNASAKRESVRLGLAERYAFVDVGSVQAEPRDAIDSERERAMGCALGAIGGGLNNTLGESMQLTFDQIWDELWILWSIMRDRDDSTCVAKVDAARRWKMLNDGAGLAWYEKERSRRCMSTPAPGMARANWTATLNDGCSAKVMDWNARGMTLKTQPESPPFAQGDTVTIELPVSETQQTARLSAWVVHSGQVRTGVMLLPAKTTDFLGVRKLLRGLAKREDTQWAERSGNAQP